MIEVTEPLRIRHRGQEVHLLPGSPIDFPEAIAEKLIKKAPGIVRLMPTGLAFPVGCWVEWNSPLFGVCRGQVVMGSKDGWLVVEERQYHLNLKN